MISVFLIILVSYLYFQQESQLEEVRMRCVRLLGSLGGEINVHLLTTDPEDLAKQAVSWDNNKHLKFEVPFMDVKPEIYFGI